MIAGHHRIDIARRRLNRHQRHHEAEQPLEHAAMINRRFIY
jgi:hypothetical protein